MVSKEPSSFATRAAISQTIGVLPSGPPLPLSFWFWMTDPDQAKVPRTCIIGRFERIMRAIPSCRKAREKRSNTIRSLVIALRSVREITLSSKSLLARFVLRAYRSRQIVSIKNGTFAAEIEGRERGGSSLQRRHAEELRREEEMQRALFGWVVLKQSQLILREIREAKRMRRPCNKKKWHNWLSFFDGED